MSQRDCTPGDPVRGCDCNLKQGMCHCSDNDCGWEPESVQCACGKCVRCRKGARCLACIERDGKTKEA